MKNAILKHYLIILSLGCSALSMQANGQSKQLESKEPSRHTIEYQNTVKKILPFSDNKDFELIEKGLIKRPKDLIIKDEVGNIVWELGNYDFLSDEKYHDSINPSLERQARLNMSYGLYKVSERIYQVRGFDLANISFIKADNGWIVFDPLLTPATAKAAYQLVTQELGEFPIHTVVYSHAHADHFGGVTGIVSPEDVKAGKVKIYAPRGFMEHAIKENVLAGNAMTRRATLQYGNSLEKGAKGQVDAAIGKGISTGYIGLIAPSEEIQEDEKTMTIDGIKMVFQNTPGTESPAEMNTYFPDLKVLWLAENVTGTLHNIYTLRGAEVRDAQSWSKFINKIIHGYAKDAKVMFASHSWPRWGNEYIIEVLEKQRDMYGYLHDQTLNLANKGVNINEIHNEIVVPDVLAHEWYNRGYHGSYSHNVRGIINKYLGFYDMNPANLNKLSPVDSAKKYVKMMGGEKHILSQAKISFESGEYRWTAELLNHLIFAQPDNLAAKYLQADTFEQLGYMAESAGWRNNYLAGAWELRNGLPKSLPATRAGPDMLVAMDSELIWDFLGVRLNREKALGKEFKINIQMPDVDQKYLLELKNSHLNNIAEIQDPKADCTVVINRSDLNLMLLKQTSFMDLMKTGKLKIEGDQQVFVTLLGSLDTFEFWFNIVTP